MSIPKYICLQEKKSKKKPPGKVKNKTSLPGGKMSFISIYFAG